MALRPWLQGDSSAQSCERGFSPYFDPFLHSSSYIFEKVDAHGFICSRTCEVESSLAIVENSKRATFEWVGAEGNIGADGWAKMAKACTRLGLRLFRATRECIVEGERRDVKAVWDALVNNGFWYVEKVLIDGTLRNTCCTCWATEEEKEGKWKGLQVEIKPLSMVLVNVHHVIIL